MKPSWRKPVGMLILMAYIGAWTVIVVSQSSLLSTLPWPIEMMMYLIAGIIWIAPMKPFLIWMETGHFRSPPV